MTRRCLVVGVGNRDRADDAVGPIVCDRLDRRAPDRIVTRVLESPGPELLHVWGPDDDVVLVDAAVPAGRPGRILAFADPAPGRPLPSPASTSTSTHAIDLTTWIELAGVVELRPRSLHLVAIEGADFVHGGPLSAAVDRAADLVVDLIVRLAASMTG